ncbi:uncharacterized protein TrAtP1_004917 [Trichoderma atroviride]|uniref:uncharacterized protein n=1 Tax=Hypocrea atroviridis TaxID=63577 RepID=UPI003324E086|nr:hypothetical protein TrAtP1_004917 [Trichoderma atroviride]
MKDTRIQGTGDWLIDHESFREWQAIASSSTLLCLQGTIGTGKTYLTSRVIDHIKQTLEASPHDEGFAFFYCNRSGPSMQDPLVVLRSFVRQLSYKANNYSYIQNNVIQKCEKAKQEGRSLSYTDCKELILESMNLYSKTTIILDALDESDISYYNLAEIFINMLDKARNPVKIFISSRPDREFLNAFEDRATIMVNSSNQQGDIEKYLDEALYSTRFFRKRRLEIQNMIKETFSTRNGGMFRWVHLQTKSLRKCVSDDAIRIWAKTIPRDLMAAYDRLWEDLTNQHNECDMVLAERAIKWVLCAFRPLNSEALLQAIRFAYEGDCLIQIELQTEQEILSLCQDLLTIDAEKKVWMLPHASVAEYFESRKSKGMGLGECDAFVSKIQLDFLMTPKLELIPNPDDDDRWRPLAAGEYDDLDLFKRYVQNNWFKHVQRYDKWLGSLEGKSHEPALISTLKRFLGSPGESSVYFRRWMNSQEPYMIKPANMAIFIMCQHGFYYTLRDWWEKDKIDQKLALKTCEGSLRRITDSVSYTLELAVEGGCLPMCRYLVSAIGAIGRRQGIYHLAAAGALSNKDILRFLVEEAKVDLNVLVVLPNYALTIVQDAIMHDQTGSTLQYLVDQGWVSANRQGGSLWGNALIAAANGGIPQSIEILLRAGADAKIPAESGIYGSALIAAVASAIPEDIAPYETKIVTLLNSGADINQVPNVGIFGSALEAFIWRIFDHYDTIKNLRSLRYIQTLKLLLKSGADPAMTCNIGQYGSALAAAAFYGMKDMVVMMINVTGKKRAIKCLQQSRYPSEVMFTGEESDSETWKKNVEETATYLIDEVGVDKKTLRSIGMQDIKYKHGSLVVYIQAVERSTSNIETIYDSIRARGRRGSG